MAYDRTVIEIFDGVRADKGRADYGQKVFLITLNESGEPFDGSIMWDGLTYEAAQQEAREMSEEYDGAPIVDLVEPEMPF
jgi:hypothetical protein